MMIDVDFINGSHLDVSNCEELAKGLSMTKDVAVSFPLSGDPKFITSNTELYLSSDGYLYTFSTILDCINSKKFVVRTAMKASSPSNAPTMTVTQADWDKLQDSSFVLDGGAFVVTPGNNLYATFYAFY